MKVISDIISNTLLLVIASFLFLIWQRMPPTVAEMDAAEGNERKALVLRQPVVNAEIRDSVDVNVENDALDVNVEGGSLDVNVENSSLDVNVENPRLHVDLVDTPLEVTVVR